MTRREKALQDIIRDLQVVQMNGDPAMRVSGIQIDSRKISPGDVFVAVVGIELDGHAFVEQAAERGAVAAVVSRPVEPGKLRAVVQVADTRSALPLMAGSFWDHPSRELSLIGITGTNGKTTLSYLLEHIVEAAGGVPGVIGTVDCRWAGHQEACQHTTPEANDLQALLFRMRTSGVTHVAMEVSSHALSLGRCRACHFQTAVFTNLSRDHLDYHGDMQAYAESKALLFSRELAHSRAPDRVAVANRDDPRWEAVCARWHGKVLTFGLDAGADVHPAGQLLESLDGFQTQVVVPGGEVDITCHLPGRYNLQNVLAAVAVAYSLDLPVDTAARGIARCKRIPGRLESVQPGSAPRVFVDYAHTDQALANVLGALRPLVPGRLLVVFGCGGDRDRGKRPLMGAEVAKVADLAVVTSDNPRTEDPAAIIEAILPGLEQEGLERVEPGGLDGVTGGAYTVEPDRRKAIRQAVSMARPEDVVLVAGKGHETYQIVGKLKSHFDDREEAAEALGIRGAEESS